MPPIGLEFIAFRPIKKILKLFFKEKGKVYANFIDFSEPFDNLNILL